MFTLQLTHLVGTFKYKIKDSAVEKCEVLSGLFITILGQFFIFLSRSPHGLPWHSVVGRGIQSADKGELRAERKVRGNFWTFILFPEQG